MDQFQPPSNGSNPPQQPNPPQYPQYGQPPAGQPQQPQQPQYGQSAPGYGQPAGQFGQQAPQYPGYPGGGYNAAAPQAAVERPQTIKNAVILMYVGAALALIGGIFSLFQVPAAIDLAVNRVDTGQLSGSELESVKTAAQIGGYVGGVFSLVVATGLWIWMAFANNAGRKWARVLATVFAAIGIISTIYQLISGLLTKTIFISSLIFNILTLLVAIAALVYLWLKPSTKYYNFKSQKVLY